MPQAKAFPFEASLKKLETLVETMEAGELSLEESLKAFQEGHRVNPSLPKSLDRGRANRRPAGHNQCRRCITTLSSLLMTAEFLAPFQNRIEVKLAQRLNAFDQPKPLSDAMAYACLGGGKRLRATLVYLSAERARTELRSSRQHRNRR